MPFWPMSRRCAPTFSFIGFMICLANIYRCIQYFMKIHFYFYPYEESVFLPTSTELSILSLWLLVPALLYIRFAYLHSFSQLFISLDCLFLCSFISGFNIMTLRQVLISGTLSLLSLPSFYKVDSAATDLYPSI